MNVAPSRAPGLPGVEGVTLEQYAGVSAAVIEGFSLAAALEVEGIDGERWPGASLGWGRQLAKAGAGGPLASKYRELVAFARGWLGREVTPLEDDLAAWLGFLNAWSAHPSPFDLLDELGMSPSDVSRIQGAWAQRIEQDDVRRRRRSGTSWPTSPSTRAQPSRRTGHAPRPRRSRR